MVFSCILVGGSVVLWWWVWTVARGAQSTTDTRSRAISVSLEISHCWKKDWVSLTQDFPVKTRFPKTKTCFSLARNFLVKYVSLNKKMWKYDKVKWGRDMGHIHRTQYHCAWKESSYEIDWFEAFQKLLWIYAARGGYRKIQKAWDLCWPCSPFSQLPWPSPPHR